MLYLWEQSSSSKPFLHWRVQAVQPLGTVFEPIQRHYEGDVLDINHSYHALKLVLRGVGPVLPDISVQEVGSAHVVVLFATASTVFRLVLPHPEAIIKVGCPDRLQFLCGREDSVHLHSILVRTGLQQTFLLINSGSL